MTSVNKPNPEYSWSEERSRQSVDRGVGLEGRRAHKRRAALTYKVLGHKLVVLPFRTSLPPLKLAGLLKVEAHCPQP